MPAAAVVARATFLGLAEDDFGRRQRLIAHTLAAMLDSSDATLNSPLSSFGNSASRRVERVREFTLFAMI